MDQNEPDMEDCTVNSVRGWFNSLVLFGIIGYILKKNGIQGKMIEQGFPVIMFGCAENSETGIY